MKKRFFAAMLTAAMLLSLVPMTASAKAQGSIVSEEITLYALDSIYADYLSIPADVPQSVQLPLYDSEGNAYTYTVTSGYSVTVTDGLVEPDDSVVLTSDPSNVYYWYKPATISAVSASGTKEYVVKLEPYTELYAQQVLEQYVAENITDDMTDLEKLETIGRFTAAYEYDYNYSNAADLIIFGGGDCFASTEAVERLCEIVGFPSHWRYAVREGGSNHRNNAVLVDGKVYIVDASYYAETAVIFERAAGWYYNINEDGEAVLEQYDGFDSDIVIPEEIEGSPVTTIDENAIYYSGIYQDITSVTIPASVTEIDQAGFSMLTTLEAIYVSEDNPNYKSVDGVLYSKDGKTLVAYPSANGEVVSVPDGVTAIDCRAFAGCGLKSVTLPDSVTAIGEEAFYRCRDLTSVMIPDSVTTIDDGAFSDCDSLTDVYYSGTEADWSSISIGADNEALTSAQLHYNSAVNPDDPSTLSGTGFRDDTGSGTWVWASQYIYTANRKGIFKGDNNGNFNPDNKLTRAEAVTALLALKGVKVDTAVNYCYFTDMDGKWYTPYVAAAKSSGISDGYANGDGTYSFKPDANITRAEFVTMLLAAMDIDANPGIGISGFTDADWKWYSGYIAAAKEAGISSGYANGDGTCSFKPNANITRAEAATMTAALCG